MRVRHFSLGVVVVSMLVSFQAQAQYDYDPVTMLKYVASSARFLYEGNGPYDHTVNYEVVPTLKELAVRRVASRVSDIDAAKVELTDDASIQAALKKCAFSVRGIYGDSMTTATHSMLAEIFAKAMRRYLETPWGNTIVFRYYLVDNAELDFGRNNADCLFVVVHKSGAALVMQSNTLY